MWHYPRQLSTLMLLLQLLFLLMLLLCLLLLLLKQLRGDNLLLLLLLELPHVPHLLVLAHGHLLDFHFTFPALAGQSKFLLLDLELNVVHDLESMVEMKARRPTAPLRHQAPGIPLALGSPPFAV